MGRLPYKNNGSRNVSIPHLCTMNTQTQAANLVGWPSSTTMCTVEYVLSISAMAEAPWQYGNYADNLTLLNMIHSWTRRQTWSHDHLSAIPTTDMFKYCRCVCNIRWLSEPSIDWIELTPFIVDLVGTTCYKKKIQTNTKKKQTKTS